ncbi:hypothetical protein X474_15860 [Dethiosulfatarculus sandiegensis]|uniref:Uncharacterized protein n=1 Tax=Dethiosulfatarculus sandiegensis TaxID=1429043 RepID=A0A0D2J4L7_9BACT|nr:hypothetical protein X474_15860 [Dethiosulfatarculus sandiegensis]
MLPLKDSEKHREFLEYLGVPNKEIKRIRSLGMA